MKTSTRIGIIATLVVFGLLPAVNAGAQRAVSRPFAISASSQMVVNLDDYSYEAEGSGVATHCGFITFVGTGVLGMGGHGTITAANGDEIWFDDENAPLKVTGGTGRFENASGTFAIQLTAEPVVDIVDAHTMRISYSWTASGTITY